MLKKQETFAPICPFRELPPTSSVLQDQYLYP